MNDDAHLTRDDLLLDLLGRGDAAPAGDDVAEMLAAWRADLVPEPEPVVLRRPVPAVPDVSVRRALSPRSGVPTRRRPRPSRVVIAAAAAVVVLAGGLSVAAGGAGPDSPLWPITRVLYADRADSRQAEQDAEASIARAREAAAQGRYGDATHLLDDATQLTGRVSDPGAVRRLLTEIAAVRALLTAGAPVVPATSPSSAGAGASAGTGPSAGATPASSGDGGGLPLPLPSVSVSVSASLPPILPLPTMLLPPLP